MIRTYLELGAALLILIAFLTYTHHERRVGAVDVERADSTAIAKQTALDQKTVTHDIQVTRDEAKNYANAVATAISNAAPVERMCIEPPSAVHSRSKTATGPIDHGGPGLRTGDQGLPTRSVNWDSRDVVQKGADANAQIDALKSYIRDVCPTL